MMLLLLLTPYKVVKKTENRILLNIPENHSANGNGWMISRTE